MNVNFYNNLLYTNRLATINAKINIGTVCLKHIIFAYALAHSITHTTSVMVHGAQAMILCLGHITAWGTIYLGGCAIIADHNLVRF